jgi:hypothetical protein
MQHVINSSKELIKNRMYRHALKFWGIKNTEDLDPAVKLIMEALALELSALANEVKDTQVRILEKVANMMAPDSLTSPNPAHAILHATPAEPFEILGKTTSFYSPIKISSENNVHGEVSVDINLTPVDAVKLLHVKVDKFIGAGAMYSYGPSFNKVFLGRSNTRQIENNTVWMGLKIQPGVDSINDLGFCFDWKNLEYKMAQRILPLLPMCKWYINNGEIRTTPGLKYVVPNEKFHNIFDDYDLLSLREKDIKDFYDKRFITIDHDEDLDLKELSALYPKEFLTMFNPTELQKLNEKLLWIKIVFPAAIDDDYLNELYIYPNAFPVMNRKLSDLKYRLKGGSNIIPLRTEIIDQFLSVRSLTDDLHDYRPVPYRKQDEEETGTYTLRSGGVERFDSRNAREMISYLMELLRSESATFASYGYDFIASTLKELHQKIALMEQKTKGYINNHAEIPNYLIVKPFEGEEMMYVQFWTTLAEIANNLRSGTRLQQSKGVKVLPDSIFLVTTTIGGKNRLKPEEKLNAFRYGLMTRNRIVTKEDIRSFCFYELGDTIAAVEVEKGYEMSLHSKQAFHRTIDVIITPSSTNRDDLEAWNITAQQLHTKLQSRSGIMSNYRVKIQTNS